MSSSTNNSNNVTVKVNVDAKAAKAETKNLKAEIDKVAKALKDLAGTIGLTFDAKAIIEFGKQAVNLAADLSKIDTAVNAAFGSMSENVDSFASTALEKFGLTEAEAKSISASFMNMGKSLGLGESDASGMALSAAQRVGDLISYYGITKEQAIAVMNSAWTGEADGLNAIGIAMDEASLDAFALNQGLGKTTKQMNEQELAMLRYKYVMEQTGAAAGNFEKTSGSWANQTTILTGSWKEFLTLMGTGLIELLTPAVEFLNEMIKYLIKFAEKFAELMESIFGSEEFSAFWENTVLPIFEKMETEVMPFLTEFGTQCLWFIQFVLGELKKILEQFWTEFLEPALLFLKGVWDDIWEIIMEKWNTYGAPIFNLLKESFIKTAELFKMMWEEYIKPIWDNFMETIDWLWEEHLKPFVDRFTEMIAKLVEGALTIYNTVIAPLIMWIMEYLYPPIREIINFIVDRIGTMIAWITDKASALMRIFSGIIDFIVGVFTGNWEKALNGIKEIFYGIVDSIVADIKWCINSAIDIINFFIVRGTRIINKMIDGLNKLEFNVPGWVPILGGKNLSFQIKTLPSYEIPKLATGAVIPPNSEFLAVLGDQRKGRNLEAPESLIRQIVKEEGSGDVTVIVQMPGGEEKEIFSTKNINRRNRISGKVIVPVGV